MKWEIQGLTYPIKLGTERSWFSSQGSGVRPVSVKIKAGKNNENIKKVDNEVMQVCSE